MIQIEPYSQADHYETLVAFWKGHGFPPPPAVFLPKLGVVATSEGKAIAAGFCYLDNSTPVAKLEWLVADPQAGAKESIRALNVVVDFLQRRIQERDLGYSVLLTTAHQKGLVRLLEHHGFIKTDSEMTHLVLILDDSARALALAGALCSEDAIPQETILSAGLPQS